MTPELQIAWVQALVVLAGSVVLGYLIRAALVRRLGDLLSRTRTEVDDLIFVATRRHLPLWFVLGGAAVAARLAPLPDRAVLIADRLCVLAFIITVSFAASRLGTSLLELWTRGTETTVPTTSLVQNVLRAVILGTGMLLVLANLGVSITPLLTALGVGSLAVALALQPTLSNLFAGMHIALARPIRIGDFVELESGQQGYVEDIGWRSTRIRALPNNLFIVPNGRVAEMIMTNFALPQPEQAALVQVGVSYDSDLHHVERVTCEVGREILRSIEGGVVDFEPFIRYHTFGDSSIDFTVILRVKGYTDRFAIIHEFIKRLKERYDREGIVIPYPQRVLHTSVEALAPAFGPGRRIEAAQEGGRM